MSGASRFRIGAGAFVGGVAVASFLVLPSVAFWGCLFAAGLFLLARRTAATGVAIVLLMMALGAWRTHAVLTRPSPLRELAAGAPTLTLEGVVDGDAVRTASGIRFPFRALRAADAPLDGRIMVYGPAFIRPRYGQELTLTGTLKVPSRSGDFDYPSYLAKDGIVAQMSYPAYDVPGDALKVPWDIRVQRPLFAIRDALGDALARAVPEPESSYLGGIVLGTRGTVDPALQDAFSRTGTSHILAISGYNITIVAGVLMAGLARLGRRRAYFASVIGVALFTLMVGASASVVRAALMGILGLTAVQLGRRQEAGSGILFSAALMTAFNPLVLRWDAGFQLSFCAVAGIVYLASLLARPAGGGSTDAFGVLRVTGWKATGWNMVATTLAAQCAVMPLILFQFGTFAVYTLPVNLLVLPLVPLAMALGFATAVAGILSAPAGALVGQVAWVVAAVQLVIIRFASGLPYASLNASLSASATLACYAALAAFVVSRYRGASVPTINQGVAHAGTDAGTAEAGRSGQGSHGGNHLPF